MDENAATVSEPLTWKQICERYPDEWVVLVEVDWVNDTDFEFRSARVAGHGKTRKEPLEQARPLHDNTTAWVTSSPAASDRRAFR